MTMHALRRKPVPRAWREDNHELSVRSRFYSAVRSQGRVTYRATGWCSCGQEFGERAGRHNMDRADVIEAWKDHVAQAFHGDDYWTGGSR